MAEPQDATMLILQKIQKDMADFRKSVEAKINDVAETVMRHTSKFEELESLMTYHLGLTSQNVHDIKQFREDFKKLTARVRTLESNKT